ncbi:hypothetical protein DSCW_22640 [Desulfosarcina widdelii]|uniref:Uncharacterized protein n=1 Tax=Desulfosarcina widdelii TaxID=947919 RepID=A0A5K7ZFG3_9BACT|nr:hypothetical protein DSCW_22640 [Desulfosarcina widdelii]
MSGSSSTKIAVNMQVIGVDLAGQPTFWVTSRLPFRQKGDKYIHQDGTIEVKKEAILTLIDLPSHKGEAA